MNPAKPPGRRGSVSDEKRSEMTPSARTRVCCHKASSALLNGPHAQRRTSRAPYREDDRRDERRSVDVGRRPVSAARAKSWTDAHRSSPSASLDQSRRLAARSTSPARVATRRANEHGARLPRVVDVVVVIVKKRGESRGRSAPDAASACRDATRSHPTRRDCTSHRPGGRRRHAAPFDGAEGAAPPCERARCA